VADWVVDSRDHKKMSFVIVDKKDAKVYVFNPSGQLKDASAALLGSAPGDDSVPASATSRLRKYCPKRRPRPPAASSPNWA
jgi:hypothetical protein